eukprot:3867076-Amphidinium_carterae.1
MNSTLDVARFLRKTNREMHKFKLFWRESNAAVFWKMTVFNMIQRAQTFYTLETLTLTTSHKLEVTHGRPAANQFQTFSTYYDQKRNVLFGHLLRASPTYLMWQTTFTLDGERISEHLPNRVGRPKNYQAKSNN